MGAYVIKLNLSRISFVNSFTLLLSFSTKSHLFTQIIDAFPSSWA